MDDDDFEKQLAFEEQEKLKNANKGEANPYIYTDPSDGTEYEWDFDKKAWFPKISEDFIAAYQASYGNYEELNPPPPPSTENEEKEKAAGNSQDTGKPGDKRKANDPTWFEVDDAHNTNVYVSNLPLDTTEEEFQELMGKCGMIMKDLTTNQMKIKLYRNSDGTLKGDGLCNYIKIESVELALSILDGSRYKDKEIHIERAKFQLKGAFDPTKKPKKKKPKDKEKMKKKIEKLFDWRPDLLRGQRLKSEKTVIIKNMFEPTEFDHDATLILEYQNDVRDECSKYGEVKKVVVCDRHPEGIVTVMFKEHEEADQCIRVMNGRWFAGRRLTAEAWDGKTKYKIQETEEELEKRLKQWDDFLDKDEAGKELKEKKEVSESAATTSQNENIESDSSKIDQSIQETEKEVKNKSASEIKTLQT